MDKYDELNSLVINKHLIPFTPFLTENCQYFSSCEYDGFHLFHVNFFSKVLQQAFSIFIIYF